LDIAASRKIAFFLAGWYMENGPDCCTTCLSLLPPFSTSAMAVYFRETAIKKGENKAKKTAE